MVAKRSSNRASSAGTVTSTEPATLIDDERNDDALRAPSRLDGRCPGRAGRRPAGASGGTQPLQQPLRPGARRRFARSGGALVMVCLGSALADRRPHRGDRLVGLGRVGAAGLGHVGPAAAALPAERGRATRTRSTALKRPVRSSVTPTTTLALPSSLAPTKTTTPEPSELLAGVGQRLQILRRDAGHDFAEEADAGDCLACGPAAVAAPPPSASFLRGSDSSRSSLRALLEQRLDAGRHIGGRNLEHGRGALQRPVLLVEILARRLAGQRLDAAHAGGDRAFVRRSAPAPMSPVRRTWVPPQSSTE